MTPCSSLLGTGATPCCVVEAKRPSTFDHGVCQAILQMLDMQDRRAEHALLPAGAMVEALGSEVGASHPGPVADGGVEGLCEGVRRVVLSAEEDCSVVTSATCRRHGGELGRHRMRPLTRLPRRARAPP